MEYNDKTYYPEYLMHYGVKGMKWGHRKNALSVKAAGHRAMAKVYDINAKTYKKSNKALSSMNAAARTQQLKKAEAAQAEANAKREQRNTPEAKAKKADKAATQKAMKNSIKAYNKKFEEAEKASNIADEKWNKVSEQYKALGKTRVTRIINAAKNKSDAAKQYNKSYNDWERSQNAADKKWNEAQEEYKKTGKNRVSRVVNNAKYSR